MKFNIYFKKNAIQFLDFLNYVAILIFLVRVCSHYLQINFVLAKIMVFKTL